MYVCATEKKIDNEKKRHCVKRRTRRDRGSGDYEEYEEDNYYEVKAEVDYLEGKIPEYIDLVKYLDHPIDESLSTYPEWVIPCIDQFNAWARNPENEGALAMMRTDLGTIRLTTPMTIFGPIAATTTTTSFDPATQICSSTDAEKEILAGTHPERHYINTAFLLAEFDRANKSKSITTNTEEVTAVIKKLHEITGESKWLGGNIPNYEKSDLYSYIFARFSSNQLPTLAEFTEIFHRYLYYAALNGGEVEDNEGELHHLSKKEIPRRESERKHAERVRANAALIASRLFIKNISIRGSSPVCYNVQTTAAVAQALDEVKTKTGLQVPVVELFYSLTKPKYYLNGAWASMYEVTPTRKYTGMRDMTPEEIEQAYNGTLENTPELKYSYMYTSACGTASETSDDSPKKFAYKKNAPLPPNRTSASGSVERERVHSRVEVPSDFERKLSQLVYESYVRR
jgi:hypothetical protein